MLERIRGLGRTYRYLIVGLPVVAAISLLVIWLVSSSRVEAFSPGLEGTVVDITTKKPVAGAYVKVSWVFTGFEGNDGYEKTVKVFKFKTDKNGRFILPSQKRSFVFPEGKASRHIYRIFAFAHRYRAAYKSQEGEELSAYGRQEETKAPVGLGLEPLKTADEWAYEMVDRESDLIFDTSPSGETVDDLQGRRFLREEKKLFKEVYPTYDARKKKRK
ncbi:MAG: carboxypeptidase-like regulatory domain-containing protein [Actinobacteria bacterium]|nr:carboxypeptidase-like regulatory domain-containing protein [Actinomycetota bacterium]